MSNEKSTQAQQDVSTPKRRTVSLHEDMGVHTHDEAEYQKLLKEQQAKRNQKS